MWDIPLIIGNTPQHRYSAADVYCVKTHSWYIFAGVGGNDDMNKSQPLDDIWKFNLDEQKW